MTADHSAPGAKPPHRARDRGRRRTVVHPWGVRLIRILLAQRSALLRAALAALLCRERDMEVVAELSDGADWISVVRGHRPDITVLDDDLPGADEIIGRDAPDPLPACPILVLTDRRRSAALGRAVARRADRLGLIERGAPPEELLTAVRRLNRGEPVLDPELALAALTAQHSPLTDREREVLEIAALGLPVSDIADKLCLASGTVRNYLSRTITKTGARTRIEAIRIAQDAGWI